MDKRASLCPYRPFKVFRSHMLCLKWGFESDLEGWMIIGQAGKKAWMRMILCKHDTIRHGNDAKGNDRTVQIKSERDCRDWLVLLAHTARQTLFLSVSGSPQKFITIMERLTQMKSWHLQPTFSNHNSLSSAILDLFLCQGAGVERRKEGSDSLLPCKRVKSQNCNVHK